MHLVSIMTFDSTKDFPIPHSKEFPLSKVGQHPSLLNYIFKIPDRRQSKTLILSTNVDQKSLETEFCSIKGIISNISN